MRINVGTDRCDQPRSACAPRLLSPNRLWNVEPCGKDGEAGHNGGLIWNLPAALRQFPCRRRICLHPPNARLVIHSAFGQVRFVRNARKEQRTDRGPRLRTIVRLLMREPRREILLHPCHAPALKACNPQEFPKVSTVKNNAVEPPRPCLDGKVVPYNAMLAPTRVSIGLDL
jgi:hypothetical protein